MDIGIPAAERAATDAGVSQSTNLITWPADGSAGVPNELPQAWIALRSASAIARIRTGWRGPNGAIPHHTEARPCSEMGVVADVCVRCSPLARLPSGIHQLGVDEGSVDAAGAPVAQAFVSFEVTGADVTPVRSAATNCELDEEDVEGFCILRGDTSLRARAFLTGSAIVELRAGESVTRSLAARAETTLALGGLSADTLYSVRMRVIGLNGASTAIETSLRTHPPLASLTITEVLADPMGPDPDQEYVEIINYGSVPLPLLRLTLADAPDRDGDEVTSGVVLAPGARALLVAARFDAEAVHGDAPIPAGVPLIRLDGPIGSGGISNSGEPLYLRDAEGRRLCAVPPIAGGVTGRCVQRVGVDPRADGVEAFQARTTCTPGGAAGEETW